MQSCLSYWFASTFLILDLLCKQVSGQDFNVYPYVQNVSQNSAYVLWETTLQADSYVEWGKSDSLGEKVEVNEYIRNNLNTVNVAFLNSLEPATRYYYQVYSGDAFSETYYFKTAPKAGEQSSFSILAMSDMQNHSYSPTAFAQIINNGVLSLFEEPSDEIACVLVPGDLVEDGREYQQWKNTFFDYGKDLFSYVPVYPILGNHDDESEYYFNYFQLPLNRYNYHPENYWVKDYSNVRIIGIDSNQSDEFQIQLQLLWVKSKIIDAQANETIDFIILQYHHPHKSELWLTGETEFTEKLISNMESYGSEIDKPIVQLYGHTHGYSRGNSQNYRHLWVNVASAGGNLDVWDESLNKDYADYSVTQAEYGFVVLDVDQAENPQLTLKRYGMGVGPDFSYYELRDSVVLYRDTSRVERPTAVSPVNSNLFQNCVHLRASDFLAKNRKHGQSHWQVSKTETGFSTPEYDIWKTYQNWYNGENTQASDDLTDEQIFGLEQNTKYWWRVRYRDRNLNWSDWSTPVYFITGEEYGSENLVENSGAESSLLYWTVKEGEVESLQSGVCNGTYPYKANHYFAVGGVCEESEVAELEQMIDVSTYRDAIYKGDCPVNFGGYVSTYEGDDKPEIFLNYYDEQNFLIGTSDTLTSSSKVWTLLRHTETLPEETQSVGIVLKGTRNSGNDNDCYFDNVFVTIGEEPEQCGVISHVNETDAERLFINPNPITDYGSIELQADNPKPVTLKVFNNLGIEQNCLYMLENGKLIIQRKGLCSGLYYYTVNVGQNTIGKGRFVVK